MKKPKTKHPIPKVHAFLAAIRAYPNIARAAHTAGISRSTHYKRYERDPVYAQAFDRAWKWGIGRLRDRAVDFIYQGIPEPVVYKGKIQYEGKGKKRRPVVVYKIPERLVMKVLSAEIPDVYNRQRLEHSGPEGGPIEFKVRLVK